MTKTLDFNQVYTKQFNRVLQHVNYKTNHSIHAEDITAETFNKAYHYITHEKPEYRFNPEKSDINTWLFTIANRIIIDYFRKYSKENASTMKVNDFVDEDGKEFIEFVGTDGNEASDNRELKEAILKAFASLKPKYRRIANLYFMHDKKYTEIAEICNVPLNTVKVMVMRCREMLQAQLQTV
jgi:RNA polymerase sigma-70 factor (ECF subfamily)